MVELYRTRAPTLPSIASGGGIVARYRLEYATMTMVDRVMCAGAQ